MRRLLPLLALLLFSSTASAQEQTASVWQALGVKTDLNDDLSGGVVQEFRFGLTLQEIEKFTTALEVSHDTADFLQLAGHYRLDLVDWDEPDLTVRHRIGLDAIAPAEVGRVKLSLRQRVQPEYRPAEDQVFNLVLRTRAKAALKLDKWAPYVDVEPYLVVGTADSPGYVERLRGDVGVAWKVPQGTIDLSYRIDEPIGGAGEDPHRHIVMLKLVGKVKRGSPSVDVATTETDEALRPELDEPSTTAQGTRIAGLASTED